MIGELSPAHLLIVAVVFIVLFGSKRLPDATRSLGRSLRIFKSEVSGLKADFKGESDAPAATAPAPVTTDAPAAIQAVPQTPAATPQDTPAQQPVQQPKA